MVAWAGIEHFRMGRFDPPPPPYEPEDTVVCFNYLKFTCHYFSYCLGILLHTPHR